MSKRTQFRNVSSLLSGLSIRDDSEQRPFGQGRSRGSLGGGRPAGARFGRGGGGASAAQRHNVARLAELDYYVRKLDQSNDGSAGPKWDMPYAKAGAAAALPDDFASLAAYLDATQSAAALEFQASISQAIQQADREARFTGDRGFKPFEPARLRDGRGGGGSTAGTWVYSGLEGGVDFDQDSWGKHLVEVEETQSFHVAVLAKVDDETEEQVLVLLPTVEHEGRSSVRIRSLGYVGPFLAQYDSAQELRCQERQGTLPAGTKALLSAVVKPSRWAMLGQGAGGTLLPSSAAVLREDQVAINASQEHAVLGLRGGVDVIHGPPGTGKSTTIYHIVDSRVAPDAQVLVTCTRNQAVDSVVDKVALLDGGILVFGNPKRMGERAAQHTLEGRVEGHDAVVAWKQGLQDLKELEKKLEAGGALYYASAHTRRDQVESTLRRVLRRGAGASLTVTMDGLEDAAEAVQNGEVEGAAELAELVAALVGVVANEGLPALRAHVKRELLASTRVFVCTIDATARMAADLAELEVSLDLDTVVVDEAGCVLESAVPLLLRLHPANLVLIGDHKQLQAFSSLVDPPRNHCRSLMERCVDAGMPAAMLSEQYRMHPDICNAISATFYRGRLRTGAGMLAKRPCSPACRLVNVNGEEVQHTGAGFSNRQEALQVLAEAEAASRLLVVKGAVQAGGGGAGNGRARPLLFIVTLYNKQRGMILDLLREEGAGSRLRTAGWEVAVLSADACQGSEAELVVLSTVRNVAPTKTSGAPLSRFFNDARRINVALSRARHLCVLVGSGATMRQAAAREPFWRSLLQHYTSC